MPKVKSGKNNQLAPGITDVSIPGPECPLVPRTRGPQAARDPQHDGRFWRPSSTAVKLYITPVYKRWLQEGVPASYMPDYGMERLDAKIEESVGNNLLVAGPLIDFYLSKIGGEVAARLRRNNGTGVASFERDVPPTVFSPVMLLIKRYGGKVDMAGPSKCSGMYGTAEITIDSFDVLRSVFSGARSDGRNFLLKMHFDRECTPDDRVISHYRGKSVVVATPARPFRLSYSSRRGRLTVTFFRQKYDRNGLAENTLLRAAQDL